MKYCTYRIRHRETGRCYFGMSGNVEARWAHHRLADGNGCHYIRAAIQAHGPEAFDWEVLERFQSRRDAAVAEETLLRNAEQSGLPVYNLRMPSDRRGLQNFAWGKKLPWIDESPDAKGLESQLEEWDAADAADEADMGLGVDPTW